MGEIRRERRKKIDAEKKKRVLEREKERERKDLKVANFRLNDMRAGVMVTFHPCQNLLMMFIFIY